MSGKSQLTPPPEGESGQTTAADVTRAGELKDVIRRVTAITTENERLLQRLMAGEQRFRGLAKAVWKVQEDERRRLALELHDGIGQTLTALINQLQRLAQRGKDDAGCAGLGAAIEIAESALEDVREMSRLLRPPVLDDLGLESGLIWLARTIRERSGLRTDIDWQIDNEHLDADVQTLVFRIVQEGLNNIVKHAGTDHAEVSIRHNAARLEITILDHGRGFEAGRVLGAPDGATGLGLRGIRDRVELFGGRFEPQAAPGQGCRLQVLIPITGSRP